jgi:hypothetical protein
MNQRRCDIRRNLLTAARELGTANLDELATHPSWSILRPSREELTAALGDLLGYGYLCHPIAGDYDYVRLTAAGLRQVNSEEKRDAAIWGRHAI